VPLEVSIARFVAWKRKEERRAIQPMHLFEVLDLLRSCLLAQYGGCRIARHHFYQESHDRNHGPHDQDQHPNPAQAAEQFAAYRTPGGTLARVSANRVGRG